MKRLMMKEEMTLTRTQQRKMATRKHILEVATEMLVKEQASTLRMEDVAVAADITRKTIYNHFASKEQLVNEIIEPILKDSLACVEEIMAQEEIQIEDIACLCLKLYHAYGSSLNLIYSVTFDALPEAKMLHSKFVRNFCALFSRIDLLADSRVNHRSIAIIVAKTFVGILDTLVHEDEMDSLYLNSMTGMIKGLL